MFGNVGESMHHILDYIGSDSDCRRKLVHICEWLYSGDLFQGKLLKFKSYPSKAASSQIRQTFCFNHSHKDHFLCLIYGKKCAELHLFTTDAERLVGQYDYIRPHSENRHFVRINGGDVSALELEILKRHIREAYQDRIRHKEIDISIFEDYTIIPEIEYDDTLIHLGTTERERIVQQRVGQNVLRSRLLLAYQGKCALCDCDDAQVLRASHIIPWSKNVETRLHLNNVILLCGLHDLAFEHRIITINPDYSVNISSESTGLSNVLKRITYPKLNLPNSELCIPNAEYLALHKNGNF